MSEILGILTHKIPILIVYLSSVNRFQHYYPPKSNLETPVKCVRLAYDSDEMKPYVERAIELLGKAGFRRRSIFVYVLYNFNDDPETLFRHIKDVLVWGAIVYPMCSGLLNALKRWDYIGPKWTKGRLEVVEDFRRVYGYGGLFLLTLGL